MFQHLIAIGAIVLIDRHITPTPCLSCEPPPAAPRTSCTFESRQTCETEPNKNSAGQCRPPLRQKLRHSVANV